MHISNITALTATNNLFKRANFSLIEAIFFRIAPIEKQDSLNLFPFSQF